eukprot:361448-Chlamydomonas_euryale.AAC.6
MTALGDAAAAAASAYHFLRICPGLGAAGAPTRPLHSWGGLRMHVRKTAGAKRIERGAQWQWQGLRKSAWELAHLRTASTALRACPRSCRARARRVELSSGARKRLEGKGLQQEELFDVAARFAQVWSMLTRLAGSGAAHAAAAHPQYGHGPTVDAMRCAAPPRPRAAPPATSRTARDGAVVSGRWSAALGRQSRPRKPLASLPGRRPHQAAAPHVGFDMPVSVQAQLGGGPAASQPTAPSFRLFKVVGDGACMFRSIVQGAQIARRGAWRRA